MNCPDCNTPDQIPGKFCRNCGFKIPEMKYCTHCGAILHPNAQFCNKCGIKLNRSHQQPEVKIEQPQSSVSLEAPQNPDNSIIYSDNPNQIHDSNQNPFPYQQNNSEIPESAPEENQLYYGKKKNPFRARTDIWMYIIILLVIIGITAGFIGFFYYNGSTATKSRHIDDDEDIENVDIEVIEETKTEGVIYLKGKIDGKYAVNMMLDLSTGKGKYCYDKYDISNSMELVETNNSGSMLNLNEYNSYNAYCGEWSGRLENGHYLGLGVFQNEEMPFDLVVGDASNNLYGKGN